MSWSSHWFCKYCIVQNHIDRDYCLQCGKPRLDVELRDEKKIYDLLEQFNGKCTHRVGGA